MLKSTALQKNRKSFAKPNKNINNTELTKLKINRIYTLNPELLKIIVIFGF